MSNQFFALVLVLSGCGSSAPPVSLPSVDAQQIVDRELASLSAQPNVRSARAIVIDPNDGRVLAIAPEIAATEVRCHGSVAKTITLTAALMHNAITPDDSFDGQPIELEGETIEDRSLHASMSVADAMAYSSNVAFTQVYQRLGRERLFTSIEGFHLGARITDSARTSELGAATMAYGGAFEATSLELASFYAAVANGGTFHAPWRTGEPSSAERMISPEIASIVMDMLEGTVSREDGTGARARIEGVRVAGKTGTMSVGDDAVFGTFIGVVPAQAPRFVVLVAIETGGHEYSGGTVAAPAFTRIARELLALTR